MPLDFQHPIVERRMAPLSKDTSGIILPFDTFGSHLNSSNKTIDPILEEKNFKAAGKNLAEVWSEQLLTIILLLLSTNHQEKLLNSKY